FRKYEVKHEMGIGKLLAPHRVKVTTKEGSKEVTADHIIIAVGARAIELPFAKFDGKQVITSREAMTLPTQPKRLAIIGAGAIGCEFADFYNAIGTEVTIVEKLAAPEAKLELFKNRVKIDPRGHTNLENVWALGDCVSLHWPEQSSMAGYRHPDLAHVAHHEAVKCVERIFNFDAHDPDID